MYLEWMESCWHQRTKDAWQVTQMADDLPKLESGTSSISFFR